MKTSPMKAQVICAITLCAFSALVLYSRDVTSWQNGMSIMTNKSRILNPYVISMTQAQSINNYQVRVPTYVPTNFVLSHVEQQDKTDIRGQIVPWKTALVYTSSTSSFVITYMNGSTAPLIGGVSHWNHINVDDNNAMSAVQNIGSSSITVITWVKSRTRILVAGNPGMTELIAVCDSLNLEDI